MSVFPISSQENQGAPSYFAKTYLIYKIYPHKEGYKVVYMQRGFDTKTIYIPVNWFYGAGSKAEILYGQDSSLPYMQVYWENGEFSHVRLFVNSDISDKSWGSLQNPENLDGTFTNETLEF